MSLKGFLTRLEAAGIEADVGQLLDAFWLATQGVDLSLVASAPTRAREEAPAPTPTPAPTHRPSLQRRSDKDEDKWSPSTLEESSPRLVFPRITSDQPETLDRPASPVMLPAPRALTNRLAVMRALRPLTRRWPSRQYSEVDEEETVEACARLWAHSSGLVMPMFRPCRERWFDVDLVLEDDGAVPVWEDMLREFATLLRETGAFNRVREWNLRIVDDRTARTVTLENRRGGRSPVAYLQGKAARRLVIFASNGASPHWMDGVYADVLVPWLRDNCTLLLQLTSPDRWARSGLGEPHGTVSTAAAGALPTALDMHLHWWRIQDADDEERDGGTKAGDAIALPVAPLTAVGLAQWADMQMARGRRNPAYWLRLPKKAQTILREGDRREEPTEAAIAQAVSLLKYESPKAFLLAVFLCVSPFTLAVARLIQAVKFDGSTDPGLLDELLRSGIVLASRQATGRGTRAGLRAEWYAVRPHARELLLRSLRERDAQEIAHELQRHVSRHIERLSGSGVRSPQLIADEQGRHRLPAWAQPFAEVATSLLGLPSSVREAERRVHEFLQLVQGQAALAIAALAASGRQPSPDSIPAPDWQALRAARLVHEREDGSWAFAPYVRGLLASVTPKVSRDEEADSLEAALSLLQSMALAFHVSSIAKANGKGIRDMFPEWPDERRAQLAHWLYVSEGIFYGPVRQILFTGEDPIHHFDVRVAVNEFEEALVQVERWMNARSDKRWRWREIVCRVWNAIFLALHRNAQVLEEATSPGIVHLLRAFVAMPVDDLFEVWYERNDLVAIIAALRKPNLVRIFAIYFSPFFNTFDRYGLSALAFAENYAGYLDRLISFWKDATVAVFEKVPSKSTDLLTMGYTVPPEAVAKISERFPQHGIRAISQSRSPDFDSSAEREVKWAISRAGYLALVDELGKIVRTAVATRLTRPARRPRVLWVDDRPDNNAHEREYILAGGLLVYEIATSTDEGLVAARASLFDVVISDMGRPGDSRAGYTLLEALRRDGNFVPFVIYSAGRKPEHIDLALSLGALGTTDHQRELLALVLRAIGRSDDLLRRPVNEDLLRQYTKWKFPGLGISGRWNERAVYDLEPDRYPTLLDIDVAVDRASEAVDAYAHERPDLFTTGTDRVTKSLGFVDVEFRGRHDFAATTLAAFERYARLVWPGRQRD